MKYVRIYSDAAGESHIEDLELALAPVQYAPPAPEIDLSDRFPATRTIFFSVPGGWYGEPHPVPQRQFYIALAGRLEVVTSDGDRRVFLPGDFALVEDTEGPGHTTTALGDEEAAGVFVHLAEGAGPAG